MKLNHFISSVLIMPLMAIILFFHACKEDLQDDPPEEFKADFSALPFKGVMPLMVQFIDESTGNPDEWRWDFGNDGIYDDSTRTPSLNYNEPGFYSVRLFVSNQAESDSLARIHYINVTSDAVQLAYDELITAKVTDAVTLTVRMGKAVSLGAVTLKLIYDNHRLEVTGVESTGMPGVQISIDQEEGTILIAWSSVNPFVIPENGAFIDIRADVLNAVDSAAWPVVIGNPVEFADHTASLIDDILLVFPAISVPDVP